MKKILVPENAGDLRAIDDMIQQSCDCEDDPNRKNTSMEAVVIRPNDKTYGEWANWTVVDNRDHQCFTEDFATLDGAMIYASDLRLTCEGQDAWDVDGKFREEMTARLAMSKPDEAKPCAVKKPMDIRLANLVMEFGKADAQIAKHGWDGGEGESAWESAKSKMMASAQRILDMSGDERVELTARELLPSIRGKVMVDIVTTITGGKHGAQTGHFRCQSRHGGKEVVEIIKKSSCVNGEKVLSAKACIVSPECDEDPYTNVEVYVDGDK